jgi:hypothetical protein
VDFAISSYSVHHPGHSLNFKRQMKQRVLLLSRYSIFTLGMTFQSDLYIEQGTRK